MTKQTFPIIGIHCASCKTLIERMVSRLDGVDSVLVNYATEKMTVEYDESAVSLKQISEAVAKAGTYKLVRPDSGSEMVLASPTEAQKMESQSHDHGKMLKQQEYNRLKRKTIIVGVLIIPFMIIMIRMLLGYLGVIEMNMHPLGMLNLEGTEYSINVFFILQFLLATPVLFWGGSQFFTSAFTALKIPAANMDTLVALGTTTAWLFSTIVTFVPGLFGNVEVDVFYEAAAFIIFFILLGRLLEARAKNQANDAVEKLMQLQAKFATVIRDGQELQISISDVRIGDVVKVRPGEKVPVDGQIIEGSSTLDESMVTGESIPTQKSTGDKVIGSTINKTSTFTFTAESVGENTLLSQIVKLVEQANATTAPVQKLADKISGVFVPIVIVIALVVFGFWLILAPALGIIESTQALELAVFMATSVLIIACPCALGLATPTAVMVGTGVAAGKGILIKNAESLELAYKTKVIVFDKTGTLTKGKPEVTDFINLSEMPDTEVLKLAGVLENMSEHPLSNAVEQYAEAKSDFSNLKLYDFENVEGMGVTGSVDSKRIAIGNKKLMQKLGISIDLISDQISELISKAITVVILSIDSKPVALFGIADQIKDSSPALITKLNQMGITTVMLTGDNQATANVVAEKLGISEVIAEVLPTDKAQMIKDLQTKYPGEVIAMVGDGINDAPALAQADIGIAMGTGTDIAIESGDIVLVSGSLEKVVEAIEVSRKTLRVIKQNLFWAFGYNVIAIPVAAGLLYPVGIILSPVIASAAMAFSSVSVVLNSLRLRYR